MAGEVVIILIGPTRSGKTSFAKLAGCNVDGSGTSRLQTRVLRSTILT